MCHLISELTLQDVYDDQLREFMFLYSLATKPAPLRDDLWHRMSYFCSNSSLYTSIIVSFFNAF